jgi:hypothetical protein
MRRKGEMMVEKVVRVVGMGKKNGERRIMGERRMV